MNARKGCDQIRTSRAVKSFRSCRHLTGSPLILLDRGRVALGLAGTICRIERARWLEKLRLRHAVGRKGVLK